MTLYGEIPSQFGVAGKATDLMLAVQSGKYGCPSHWRVADRSSVTRGAMYISQTPANDYRDFEKWEPNILEEHVAIILELSPHCMDFNATFATGSSVPNPFLTRSAGGKVRSFLHAAHDARGRPTSITTPGGMEAGADADVAFSYALVNPHSRPAT